MPDSLTCIPVTYFIYTSPSLVFIRSPGPFLSLLVSGSFMSALCVPLEDRIDVDSAAASYPTFSCPETGRDQSEWKDFFTAEEVTVELSSLMHLTNQANHQDTESVG